MTPRILTLTLRASAMLLLVPTGAHAQTRPLTLTDAVAQAVARYPAVQAATEQSRQADANLALSRTTFLPRADLVWQVNRATRNNLSGLLLPQSVIGSITGPVTSPAGDTTWNHAAGTLLAWEPVDFGARGAAVRAADAARRAAGAGLELTKAQVAAVTADAYLAALAADQGRRAAQAGVDRAHTIFDVVDARARAGLRPGADAARAKAEVAAADTGLALMQRDAAIARAELARWVGVAPDDMTLTSTPSAAASGLSAAPLPTESAPAVQQQAARVAGAEASETAAARAWAPRIFVEATAFTRESGIGPDGTTGVPLQAAHNWAAGVNVTFPLFDWQAQGARRAAEHAHAREAAARYDQTLSDVRTDQIKAQAVNDAARRVAELSAPQLDAARAAQEQARARYDSGLGTIADVAETNRMLTDAEVNSAVASLNAVRAVIAVAAAGGSLESLMSAVRAAEGR